MLPVVFVGSLTGAFFRPLALSYALAVLVSMVVALTVTPALSLVLLSRGSLKRREAPLVRVLKRGYGAVLERVIRRPRAAYAAVAAVLLLGVVVGPAARPGALPELQGARLPHALDHDARHLDAGGAADRRPGPATRCGPSTACGASGRTSARPSWARRSPGANFGENWVSVDPKADYDKTLASIHEVVDGHPGLYRNVQTYMRERIDEVLVGTSEPIVVRIYGDDLAVLRRAADRVRGGDRGRARPRRPAHVAAGGGAPDRRPRPARGRAPLRRQAGDVRRAAATLVASEEVGDLFQGGRTYDVHVWSTPGTRWSLTAIRPLPIDTPRDGQVPLATLADVRIRPTPNVIERERASRRIDVAADLPTGRDLGSVTRDVEDAPAGRRPAAGLPRRAAGGGRRAQGRPEATCCSTRSAPRS